MAKNTSILLGDYFDNFIQKKLNSGEYASASEVVRAALRMLEREEKKAEYVIQALIDGENSGMIKDFDPDQHLKELQDKHMNR
ncbi:MAG: type II toxin-antitoxin system ParD family antitoxin [Saprospiraceae bacterium]|nr:type II toxin-antitoxin system ParD family antitoxin [Saprospiraceae bacterium]